MSTSSILLSSASSSTKPLGSVVLPPSAVTLVNGSDNQDSNDRVGAIRSRTDLSSSLAISAPLTVSVDVSLINRDLFVSVPVKELEELLEMNRKMELLIKGILNVSIQSASPNQEKNSTSGPIVTEDSKHSFDSSGSSVLNATVNTKTRISDERRLKSKQRRARNRETLNEINEILKRSEARLADKSKFSYNFKKV